MTFKDVVIKNFRGGFKKYFAYFLACSFSIMLLFMYAGLLMNKELREDDDLLSLLFIIIMVAISLFSIFFINYAHSAFIKGRNKEFGIYISLGINSKELRNLINIESIIISSVSLIVGMGVGALFSRLFQMVVLHLLDIKNISFYLDYKSFLLTTIVFIFIFATVMARTYIRMRRIDISSLLKEARTSEGKDYRKLDLNLGVIGIIIMVFSVVSVMIITKNEDLISSPVVLISYVLASFLGVYLVLSNGGNLIVHLIKRSRHYYKNMLSITELHHKFNQNKKIIFTLSVLSTMTIFLVASPFSLLSLSESIAEMNKNDLEYVETATMNKLSTGTLDQIINEQPVTSNSILKFIFLSTKEGSDLLSDCKPVISAEEYNTLTGSDLSPVEGEAYIIGIDGLNGEHGIKPGSIHMYYNGENAYRFQIKDSSKGEWITGDSSFPTDSIIIINKADYDKISTSISGQNIGYYHLINFQNWKNSKEVVTALKIALGDSQLPVISTVETYEYIKRGYSVFLFISAVMGVMFFIAGGSVLYFKQFTELAESKDTFYKLYKIGISDKEMKSVIGKELLVVFFLPLIFGSFLGIMMIYLMTYINGGGTIVREFLTNTLVVIAIYFISQGIFYLITRNKYIKEIVKA